MRRHGRQHCDGLSVPQGAGRSAPARWTQTRRTLALTRASPDTRQSRTPFRPRTRATPAPHCLQRPRRCCRHARRAPRRLRCSLPGRAARAHRPAGRTLAACAASQALASRAVLRHRCWQQAASEAHQQSSLAVSKHAPSGDHLTPAHRCRKAQPLCHGRLRPCNSQVAAARLPCSPFRKLEFGHCSPVAFRPAANLRFSAEARAQRQASCSCVGEMPHCILAGRAALAQALRQTQSRLCLLPFAGGPRWSRREHTSDRGVQRSTAGPIGHV